MSLLSNAENALVRNWRTILLYIVAFGIIIGLYYGAGSALDRALVGVPAPTIEQVARVSPKPAWYVTGKLVADVVVSILVSLCQVCAYARIGSDIDRPLWKCGSDREAITRFAVMWIILNLTSFILFQVPGSLYERDMYEASALSWLLAMTYNGLYVPVGICLMHHGSLKDLKLSEALMPLLHFLPRTLLVGTLAFLQLYLIESILSTFSQPVRDMPWVIALVNMPLMYLECLGVAIVWITCAEYRAVAAEHQDDDDFDF